MIIITRFVNKSQKITVKSLDMSVTDIGPDIGYEFPIIQKAFKKSYCSIRESHYQAALLLTKKPIKLAGRTRNIYYWQTI